MTQKGKQKAPLKHVFSVARSSNLDYIVHTERKVLAVSLSEVKVWHAMLVNSVYDALRCNGLRKSETQMMECSSTRE